jgi:hypothetical protein
MCAYPESDSEKMPRPQWNQNEFLAASYFQIFFLKENKFIVTLYNIYNNKEGNLSFFQYKPLTEHG